MKKSNNHIARGTVAAAVLALGMAMAGQSASAGSEIASASGSHPVAEGQAAVTELGGNAKAVTYWSRGPEGAVVVTTVGHGDRRRYRRRAARGRSPDVGPAARSGAADLGAVGGRCAAAGAAY